MPSASRTGNLLLDALPPDAREHATTGAHTRPIIPGEEIVSIGDTVEAVFFPLKGTLSILAEPDDETIVEASSIGNEGAADVFAAIGALKVAHRMIGQVPGEMLVTDAKRFADVAAEQGRSQTLVFSYIQALYSQAAISTACNAKHLTEQRAARWLLQTHDRVEGDTFELKQEFLAFMLGVTRPSVSLAAETLKAAALIRYSRGTITVLDREGLESVACKCYEQIRLQYSSFVEL
jgi:CRP-like cAMP-binding protein